MADHPAEWAATSSSPGINYLNVAAFSDADIERIRQRIEPAKRAGHIVVLSLHWGAPAPLRSGAALTPTPVDRLDPEFAQAATTLGRRPRPFDALLTP
jgi:hypothetical protein